ncbi:hypothetical protein C8J57DRAFT_1240483 [Mycena rebaudengoi]|nr:hypothetical protein C8J57DRAFT_1240483 [Mycena rebaudengoi]
MFDELNAVRYWPPIVLHSVRVYMIYNGATLSNCLKSESLNKNKKKEVRAACQAPPRPFTPSFSVYPQSAGMFFSYILPPQEGEAEAEGPFSATTDTGKRRSSPSENDASRKKQRTSDGMSSGAAAGSGTSASGSRAANSGSDGDAGAEEEPTKRVRNPWGIRPKEVPAEAKPTQRAFQRIIRAMCGLLTQHDVLPSAIETRKHYDKHYPSDLGKWSHFPPRPV